ncbi:hypothetical protein [Klebsiella aerogenes]|uniref:hypothetical protein n=1 Tax=Klebsiella aerogenes TaxID=548 RepID=UPI001868830B|nr:hypothetical protein [Klebsiella aerogenes]
MNKDAVLIYSALIALSGVILSAVINLCINHINRNKSRNEWKRDKLLSLTNEFIESFYKDVKYARENGDASGISDVQDYVPTLFNSSEKALYNICMLLDENASNKAYAIYSEMRKTASTFVTDRILKMHLGEYYAKYETMKNEEIKKFIKFISEYINRLK